MYVLWSCKLAFFGALNVGEILVKQSNLNLVNLDSYSSALNHQIVTQNLLLQFA